MGNWCQSARGFLLPPRPQFQQHICGHKATSGRQRDRQTDHGADVETNKGRQRWPQEQVKTGGQWLVLTVFDLSQLFLYCQVHVFLCALPCLSVSHTLKCQKWKPWLKKELLTEGKNMFGSPRDSQKGSMLLCVYACLTRLPTCI